MISIFKIVKVSSVCLLAWLNSMYDIKCQSTLSPSSSTNNSASINFADSGTRMLTAAGSCPMENVGTEKAMGIFMWPETKVGSRARITCPYDLNAFATRECQYIDEAFRGISWGSVDDKACPYHTWRSQKMLDLSEIPVNSSNVIVVGKQIRNLSFPGEELISDDVANAASVLENIVAVKGISDEVANYVFNTIDNILDARLQVVTTSQRRTNSSLRIVQSLNTLLEALNIREEGSFRKILRNFAVDLSIVDRRSFSGVTFSGTINDKISAPLRNESIVKTQSDNEAIFPPKATTISLPQTLFNDIISGNASQSQTVIFALYKETKFFRVISSGPTNLTQRLNSFVIAGSIKGQSISNLTTPVVLTYSNLRPGDKMGTLCGFWNFSQASWSHEGCTFQGLQEDGRIICHCDHLTNFAMLMDIYSGDATSHEEVLGLISYIGCALSLVGLMLTIITILLFKGLRSNVPSQILLNFCIALSLTLVVFLAAAERSRTSSSSSCRAAAIALHYLVLVVFMWMAIEAFNMYLAFVKVLPSYFPRFILKCCFVAWASMLVTRIIVLAILIASAGIPAVIVSTTMAVALDDYGGPKYCRLQGVPFLVSFLAPVLLVFLGNSIAFLLIFRSLLNSGSNITSDRKLNGFQQARQGAAILVLLGLTWLFGVLAIDNAKIVFQYLFCIFNSLQGLLVFVFYCVLPPGTRKKFKHLLQKKKMMESGTRKNMEADSTRRGNSKDSYSETNGKRVNRGTAFIVNTVLRSPKEFLDQPVELISYKKNGQRV